MSSERKIKKKKTRDTASEGDTSHPSYSRLRHPCVVVSYSLVSVHGSRRCLPCHPPCASLLAKLGTRHTVGFLGAKIKSTIGSFCSNPAGPLGGGEHSISCSERKHLLYQSWSICCCVLHSCTDDKYSSMEKSVQGFYLFFTLPYTFGRWVGPMTLYFICANLTLWNLSV